LLFNANSAIFLLYHGTNKLIIKFLKQSLGDLLFLLRFLLLFLLLLFLFSFLSADHELIFTAHFLYRILAAILKMTDISKFWKHRIAPLMVTYHYVKFYVSIIIHLEVININVRNFNFPIGLKKNDFLKYNLENNELFYYHFPRLNDTFSIYFVSFRFVSFRFRFAFYRCTIFFHNFHNFVYLWNINTQSCVIISINILI
jgi:hypothetical protein